MINDIVSIVHINCLDEGKPGLKSTKFTNIRKKGSLFVRAITCNERTVILKVMLKQVKIRTKACSQGGRDVKTRHQRNFGTLFQDTKMYRKEGFE